MPPEGSTTVSSPSVTVPSLTVRESESESQALSATIITLASKVLCILEVLVNQTISINQGPGHAVEAVHDPDPEAGRSVLKGICT